MFSHPGIGRHNSNITACIETTQNSIFNVLCFFFSGIEMPFTSKEKTFKHLT